MAITRQAPRCVRLAGDIVYVNNVKAGEAITPGHLVERYNASGTPKFRKHATAGGNTQRAVALDQSMFNRDIDDAYSSGDLVEVGIFRAGDVANLLLASGENVVAGDQLESKGTGEVRKLTSGTPLFIVVEGVDNSAGVTAARVKAEAM